MEVQVYREQITYRAQRLDKHEGMHIIIRSDKENHPIYIGGKGKYRADFVHGWPLYGGNTLIFPVRNSSEISAIAEVPGEYIEYIMTS